MFKKLMKKKNNKIIAVVVVIILAVAAYMYWPSEITEDTDLEPENVFPFEYGKFRVGANIGLGDGTTKSLFREGTNPLTITLGDGTVVETIEIVIQAIAQTPPGQGIDSFEACMIDMSSFHTIGGCWPQGNPSGLLDTTPSPYGSQVLVDVDIGQTWTTIYTSDTYDFSQYIESETNGYYTIGIDMAGDIMFAGATDGGTVVGDWQSAAMPDDLFFDAFLSESQVQIAFDTEVTWG